MSIEVGRTADAISGRILTANWGELGQLESIGTNWGELGHGLKKLLQLVPSVPVDHGCSNSNKNFDKVFSHQKTIICK